MLTCTQLSIPMIICGKAGTSKSLSLAVVMDVLAKDLKNIDYLKYFNQSKFVKFHGADWTKAEELKDKIFSCFFQILLDTESDAKWTFIFEEAGIAQNAPGHSTKVIHSLIESRHDNIIEEIWDKLKKYLNELVNDSNHSMQQHNTNNPSSEIRD